MFLKKRRKLSKNKKKNWKKTDIADVEEYLEEKRFEERVGGAASEKPDAVLFHIDKAPSAANTALLESKKTKWLNKPLSCYKPLENNSKVPAFKSGSISKPWQPKLKLKQNLNALKKKSSPGRELFDLWGKEESSSMPEEGLRARVIPKRPAALYKATSVRPHVEVAHPGQSYNPSYEDHQALLQNALDTEMVKETREKKLTKEVSKFKKVPRNVAEANWMKDMASGLGNTKDDEEEEEQPTGEKKIVKKMPERKTRRDRNKEKRKRENEVALRRQRREKKKRLMYNKIPSITREVKAIQKKLADRAVAREAKNQIPDVKPKRIGRVKYAEPIETFKLSSELEGSLRLLKHTSKELLKDRYHSLLRRNILEPKEPVKQKRARKKTKWVIKRSHREFEEQENLRRMKDLD